MEYTRYRSAKLRARIRGEKRTENEIVKVKREVQDITVRPLLLDAPEQTEEERDCYCTQDEHEEISDLYSSHTHRTCVCFSMSSLRVHFGIYKQTKHWNSHEKFVRDEMITAMYCHRASSVAAADTSSGSSQLIGS